MTLLGGEARSTLEGREGGRSGLGVGKAYPGLHARVARECRASREASAMTAALKGA